MSIDVITFGCRLNTYESEVMKAHALQAGLSDTLIFNTCAVTAQAEKQARQAIRKARRAHPEKRIVVTGCAAQINPASFAGMAEVDLVLGNDEKMKADEWMHAGATGVPLPAGEAGLLGVAKQPLSNPGEGGSPLAAPRPHPDLQPIASRSDGANPTSPGGRGAPAARAYFTSTTEKTRVNDIMSVKETASHLVASFDGRARAFVQVQNGCNHRCTFCIIPFGRGNSRSVPIGEIVTQVRALVAAGYNEIVLTGVDVSDYGSDLPGTPSLGAMMRRLLALVPGLKRLRLSSIDAIEVDDELYRLIADEPRLMPHIHVSLQAGDDMVLKRMKRRHNRADIVAFCEKMRTLRPDVVFGADIIAGFPTETDDMFENSLRLIDEVKLTYLHVFPYSARTGTPAARMPQVPMAIRRERAAKLRAAGELQLARYYRSLVGKSLEIVVEQDGKSGHAEGFARVLLPHEVPVGSLQRVNIARAQLDAVVAA